MGRSADMPEPWFYVVAILLIVTLLAVTTRNRGGEVPDEPQTLDTLGPDDR
jgi:hypothetical protein